MASHGCDECETAHGGPDLQAFDADWRTTATAAPTCWACASFAWAESSCVYKSATCVFRPPPDQHTGELAGVSLLVSDGLQMCPKALQTRDDAWKLRSGGPCCVLRCHDQPSSHATELAPDPTEMVPEWTDVKRVSADTTVREQPGGTNWWALANAESRLSTTLTRRSSTGRRPY